MSLPFLLSTVPSYFEQLNLPHLCVTDSLQMNDVNGPRQSFKFANINKCGTSAYVLIPVEYIQDCLVTEQSYVLIDYLHQVIEYIVPYIQTDVNTELIQEALLASGAPNYKLKIITPDMLSSNLSYPYFLSLYYLEQRLKLTNPEVVRASMPYVPNSEIYNYKQHLIPFAYTTKSKSERGIIFCQNKLIVPDGLPEDVDWYFVQKDYTNFERLQKLGLFNWDYVVLSECDTVNNIIQLEEALRAGRWLLRSQGEMLITAPNFRLTDLEKLLIREMYAEMTQLGTDFIFSVN